MLRKVWRRVLAPPRGERRHRVRIFAAALFGLVTAGCNFIEQPIGPLAASRAATIAIESIEGPPTAMIGTLTANLKDAAEIRQLAIVAREDQAQYRLRGYFTAHAERGKASIAWVLDIYGPDLKRVARISGEEPARNDGGDAWAAADSRVLRRIAQSGMDRISQFLNPSESGRPSLAAGDLTRGIVHARTAPTSEFR